MVKRVQDRSTIGTHHWRVRVRADIAHRAGYRCERCGTFCGMQGHVDHVISRAKGRKTGLSPWARDNLQYLCPPCHNAKSVAERWEGHEKRDRTGEIRRSNVQGRDAFHHAILSAINCTPQESGS